MVKIAIIGLQWGDEGKGKIVDYLSNAFDAVIRFQGGHNAGHTVKVGDKIYKLNLLPSGIIRGKLSVIGSGVVVDPVALFAEIAAITKNGIKVNKNNLYIADNAPLILSLHKELDQFLEANKGKKKIGTTRRGIGPAYEDLVGRRAIRICDLAKSEILKERVDNLLFYHNILRRHFGAKTISNKALLAEIEKFKDELLTFSRPSFLIGEKLREQKNIIFEGAQGALLDVSFGTYPFVTSSHTIAGQVALGSGLGVGIVDKTIGVLKAYTTRVGAGPFPTELKDQIGDFLRSEGNEFGTVTGRERRCGWFDAALVKQSIALCDAKIIALTKLDVLDKLEKIKICVAYKINGKKYDYLPAAISLNDKIEPIYEEFSGWKCSSKGAKSMADLPKQALAYIKKIESLCGVKVEIISTGPKRDETIEIGSII